MNHTRGFTLIELLVVISIIGMLSSIVLGSLSKARDRATDAKIRLEVKSIITAIALYQTSNNGQYPGAAANWQCIKASGTCWRNNYSGNSTIANQLAPYISTLPKTPETDTSQYFADSYLYYPNYPSSIGSSPAGTYLIWAQKNPINDCQGYYAGAYDNWYYCYQLLSQ